ncbi:MAG: hypothetical protein KatS3mg031_2680 [Chitinophagales bacterium]|nr:MAG: hypothetical protein KatS3mg031_2680 [Chitinophagales bacterium]
MSYKFRQSIEAMSVLLTELYYLPPVSWFALALRHESVCLEQHEHFVKSTYRNRCYIASPEGRLRLTIPLLHGRSQRRKYADVRISYDIPWQRIHWNSLCACYRSSPYFEYYEEHLASFYREKCDSLFAFNLELLKTILRLLHITVPLTFTENYRKHAPPQYSDYRGKPLPVSSPPYPQVFIERTGFIEELSIVDLLFNLGPDSVLILRGSAPTESE